MTYSAHILMEQHQNFQMIYLVTTKPTTWSSNLHHSHFAFGSKQNTHTHRERAAQQMTTTTTTTKIKPVIGVDVDDVLTPLISHLLKFYNRKHDAQIRFEDFLSFRYHEVNIHTYINAFNPCNNKSFRFGVERKKILTRLWMNSSLAQNF
jgi:hypothetical protein